MKHALSIIYTKQSSNKHRASIEQTSSKHQTIRAHVVHVYFGYICLMVARCLLDCVNWVLGVYPLSK